MKPFAVMVFLFNVISFNLFAEVYVDDFSGDLSQWTAGPAHLDNYGIVDGELFLDGWGHLTGIGGWGVLQFNQPLGSNFEATWEAKITFYDYANFVLYADSPWELIEVGHPINGYGCWLDINDPTNPLMDLQRYIDNDGTHMSANIPLNHDIPNDEYFQWKILMHKGHLNIFINDEKYIEIHDHSFANSNFKIGLSFGEDSQGYIDNFMVNDNPDFCPEGDFNHDCRVDLYDVVVLASLWLDSYDMADTLKVADNWLACNDPGQCP